MNIPFSLEDLVQFFEVPAWGLVVEAERFHHDLVVPVLMCHFAFGAQPQGRAGSVELMPYKDAHASMGDDVPKLCVYCYAWSLQRLADGCDLVSVVVEHGSVAKLNQPNPKLFPLVALAAPGRLL